MRHQGRHDADKRTEEPDHTHRLPDTQNISTFEAAGLLEQRHVDERGTILVARQRLDAESFEISVPIKVYGVSEGKDAGYGDFSGNNDGMGGMRLSSGVSGDGGMGMEI